MKKNKNLRIAQIYENGKWKIAPALSIKKGMYFRMFEPTGESIFEDGMCGIAEDNCYNDNGIFTVSLTVVDEPK